MCRADSRTLALYHNNLQNDEENSSPELHLIAESLLWRGLMSVEENVLVVAAVEAALVSVDPAGRIVLLQKVSFTTRNRVRQTFYQAEPFGSGRQSLWNGTPSSVPLMPPSQIQVGLSRTDILRVPPDLSLGPW